MHSMEMTLPRPQLFHQVSPRPHSPIQRFALVLPFVTSALLWLCYFPAACGWLIWIALVPLLTLVRGGVRPARLYLYVWLGGLCFDLAAMQWMRVADPRMYATWIGLALYCSFYFPLAVYLIRLLDRRTRLPLVLAVPVVWTALEYLRSTLAGGFSWYLLAHTQHDYLPIIQIADITGAYGVSFLIAAVNGLLVSILFSVIRRRQPSDSDAHQPAGASGSMKQLLVQAFVVTALLGGTVGYGYWRMGQERRLPGPRIAILQGNLDQRLRNDSAVSEEAATHVGEHFRDLADLASHYRPDLIVWPETSWPYAWREEAGKPIAPCQAMAKDMAARWRTHLLIGCNAEDKLEDGSLHRFNTAIAVDAKGRPAGRYDKIHRVPFGEYVPFRESLPFMNKLAPYDFDYSVWPGQSHTRFPLVDAKEKNSTFGLLICYEDTDAEVAHSYGGGGADTVDFLLNISNDGWFDGTSEHDEHLAVCRFRAVECRRSVARSVNMGISAVIDSNGRVLQPQEQPRPDPRIPAQFHIWKVDYDNPSLPVSQWREYKKVAGVLLAAIPLDDRQSLYARWGDWLPWSCWIALGVWVVFAFVRRRQESAQTGR
jgi:apolipoprotein N-acyltransferase